MNVLVLGSGGREHAISWKLAQSPKLSNLYVAPGNAGTTNVAENLNIGVNDFEGIKNAVLDKQIDLVIVGPEDPLVNGIVDFFLKDDAIKHIPVIGPQAEAAQLEGSKEFSKRFMQRNGVPTAGYEAFTKDTLEDGLKYLETQKPPFVLKADGLAAGKGVVILDDLNAAKAELKAMLADAKFGDASSKVVIEEFMSGIELSVFVITDGKDYVILPEAKDYKRIGEGDTGLNTGGMGAISPVPFADKAFMERVEKEVVIPTINGFKKENLPYKGFVFIGLMNENGTPRVVEYNVRMGDPETEVVMPRLKSDLLEIMQAVAEERLGEVKVEFEDKSAATIIMVSGGYPEAYEKGKEISGLDKTSGSLIFHAGTTVQGDKVVTNGGRVIAVTSFGKDFNEALIQSYKNTEIIDWSEKYFRTDLGFDLQQYT